MAFHFGKKVIQYRQKNNITIQEMAERTQLSTAVISKIERGLGNPTYTVLQAIANEMGISVSKLVMEEIRNEDLVLRREDRKIMHDSGDNFIIYGLLTENPVHSCINMMYIRLAPHSDTSGGYWIHPEEECLYVLEGNITMEFEHETVSLRPGDSLRILPGRKHILHNDSDKDAYIVNVKCKVAY